MSEGLWTAWDPAPAILAGAGLTLLLFARAFVRLRRLGRTDHAPWSRLLFFLLAVTLGTLALVSPLDEIGDTYLLSGHMLQHVLIGDVAPALALVALRGPLLFFVLPRCVVRPLARSHSARRLLAAFRLGELGGDSLPARFELRGERSPGPLAQAPEQEQEAEDLGAHHADVDQVHACSPRRDDVTSAHACARASARAAPERFRSCPAGGTW